MGEIIVFNKVCLGVVGHLVSSPEIRVSLPWLMKLLRSLEWDLSLGGQGSSEKASVCICSFFECHKLKIINISKWHILGWHVLNFCSHQEWFSIESKIVLVDQQVLVSNVGVGERDLSKPQQDFFSPLCLSYYKENYGTFL